MVMVLLSHRQYQFDDLVELIDDDGDPLDIQALVLADEADGDTHIRVEGIAYPADCVMRVERKNLRLVPLDSRYG